MKCIVCHGDDIQVKEVKEEIKVDNDIGSRLLCVELVGKGTMTAGRSVFWNRWNRSSRREELICKRWAKFYSMDEILADQRSFLPAIKRFRTARSIFFTHRSKPSFNSCSHTRNSLHPDRL